MNYWSGHGRQSGKTNNSKNFTSSSNPNRTPHLDSTSQVLPAKIGSLLHILDTICITSILSTTVTEGSTWADPIMAREIDAMAREIDGNFNLNGLEVHQQSGECSNLKMVTGLSYSRSLGDSESDSGPRTVIVTEIIAAAGRGQIQFQLCPIMAVYMIWFNMVIV